MPREAIGKAFALGYAAAEIEDLCRTGAAARLEQELV